jgi:flagellar biosynthesis protein FlhG
VLKELLAGVVIEGEEMTEDAAQLQTPPRKRPIIWAVGGGKGGVGKSVIATNLGAAVARLGQHCVLVDADLGGANLHTMMGLPSPKTSLSSLFNHESASLNDLITPTGIDNLDLISGAGALLDMANPKHSQKLKLIRQLMTINADVVLLDLGAGSSFNVVDFYNTAHNSILVVVPTPTSIENAYHFLNVALQRRFKQAVLKTNVAALADRALAEKHAHDIRSIRDLVRYITREAPEAGLAIHRAMASLRPKLIVNQVRREEDQHLCDRIAEACRNFFGVVIEPLGAIRNDDRVLDSILAKKPLLSSQPNCQFSTIIDGMALRLVQSQMEVQHA